MGLRDVIRAIREYPSLSANLESARTALNQSEQKRRKLLLEKSEQSCQLKLLTSQSAALQAALTEFCPQISSAEEMKRLYDAISPSLDSKGFGLYHTAEQLTGLDVPSFFSYEDNRGLFEGMDGWLTVPWGSRGSTSGAFSPRTVTGRPLPVRGGAASKSADTPASSRGTSCPTSRGNGAKTD